MVLWKEKLKVDSVVAQKAGSWAESWVEKTEEK
jgi:hypothetical protein